LAAFSGVLLVSSCQPTGIELSEKHADRIVIVKSAHIMMLTNGNQVLRTYSVALGRESAGLKEYAGDHKTPEGKYIVDSKGDHSLFYLALHLSYPNAADAERAQKLGKDPEGRSRFTDFPTSCSGWARCIARSIGPAAVSLSQIPR
jgi:L,D-transpeptidase catalytic domain